jgi:protease PrsW
MICGECQYSLFPEALFCPNCGKRLEVSKKRRGITAIANKLVGNVGPSDLKLRALFSQVFRRHTEEEGEALFLVGTSQTTPPIHQVLDSWPKPWFFARIFLFVGILYVGLLVGFEVFNNANFFPGLIMVGSFMVPITLLIFFWEMNVPQNISIYQIIKILFIGGILSLVTAVFFYKNIGDRESVITIGIVEEVAKLIIILWYLHRKQYRYILNGLLVGAAVGTGFSAFESAGYALRAVLFADFETMYFTIFWRGVLAPGGHIVWAALSGAAICIARGNDPFSYSLLLRQRFLRIFILVVAMHAVWDLPWPMVLGIPVAQIGLTLFTWMVAFGVIDLGIKEIALIKKSVERFRSERHLSFEYDGEHL